MMPLSLSLGSLFEAYVKKVMHTYDASGIAVAIVDREQPVRELFFGFRDQEQKRLIDQDTIFGLASVTKSFTCLAVLQLAQQGKVDLDAPVSRYIPAFQNAHREKPVLVRHLMSHAGSFWPVERKTVEPLARKMGLWNSGVDLAYSAPFLKPQCRKSVRTWTHSKHRWGNPVSISAIPMTVSAFYPILSEHRAQRIPMPII